MFFAIEKFNKPKVYFNLSVSLSLGLARPCLKVCVCASAHLCPEIIVPTVVAATVGSLLPLSPMCMCHIYSFWSDNKNVKFINADYPISFLVKLPPYRNTCNAVLCECECVFSFASLSFPKHDITSNFICLAHFLLSGHITIFMHSP